MDGCFRECLRSLAFGTLDVARLEEQERFCRSCVHWRTGWLSLSVRHCHWHTDNQYISTNPDFGDVLKHLAVHSLRFPPRAPAGEFLADDGGQGYADIGEEEDWWKEGEDAGSKLPKKRKTSADDGRWMPSHSELVQRWGLCDVCRIDSAAVCRWASEEKANAGGSTATEHDAADVHEGIRLVWSACPPEKPLHGALGEGEGD